MHLMLLQQLPRAVQRQRRMGSERRSTAANRKLLACASAHFYWDLMKRPLFSLSHVILCLLPVDHNTCSVDCHPAAGRICHASFVWGGYGVGLQSAEFAAGLHLFSRKKEPLETWCIRILPRVVRMGWGCKAQSLQQVCTVFFSKERASRGMVYPCMVQLARDTFHADGG